MRQGILLEVGHRVRLRRRGARRITDRCGAGGGWRANAGRGCTARPCWVRSSARERDVHLPHGLPEAADLRALLHRLVGGPFAARARAGRRRGRRHEAAAAPTRARAIRIRARRCRATRAAGRTGAPRVRRRRACAPSSPARAASSAEPQALDSRAHERPDLGPLRRHDPAPRRGGADHDQAVGSRDGPARQRRPAPGQHVSRVPQPPHRGDRPGRAAAEPHRADRRSPTTSRSSSTPASSCLGRTLEWVELPDDVVARIEGKSSLGRLGLIVHATAGFVDPGWKGTLTLEITNLTRVPIKLWAGKPIAQLSFMTLDAPALRPTAIPSWAATTTARSRRPRAATRADRAQPPSHRRGRPGDKVAPP